MIVSDFWGARIKVLTVCGGADREFPPGVDRVESVCLCVHYANIFDHQYCLSSEISDISRAIPTSRLVAFLSSKNIGCMDQVFIYHASGSL